MTIDILKNLQRSGELKHLIHSGVVPSRIEMWINLFEVYENEYIITASKMQAMENVSISFDVSVELIQKIRKKFEISTK